MPVSHDTLIHQLIRPPVRAVARTPVTPNQVTTLRLVAGLAAGGAFAVGGTAYMAVGGVLMLVSLLLDRADGELARQTGLSSIGGYRYDLVCDCLGNIVAFIGVGIGLRATMGWWGVILGASAGISIVALFYLLNVAKVATTKGVSSNGRTLVDPDDAMLLVPFMVWFGVAPWIVEIGGTVTPLVAIVVGVRAALRLRRVSTVQSAH
jgi:archaetidylinositol phosphate synthase